MFLAVIALVVWGGEKLFFGEREGVVKYDDCRQIITLPSDTLQKYYKTFTCTYSKTKSGKIMGGECVHIENEGSLFTSSHACSEAYVYQRKSEENCTDPKAPYLGYDDMCHAF